jgi:calmodulin
MATPSEDELEDLRESFEYNDRDGDGMIEFDEFVQMLTELESEISKEEAKIGFRDIDTNEDGLIDFDEFLAWWTSE